MPQLFNGPTLSFFQSNTQQSNHLSNHLNDQCRSVELTYSKRGQGDEKKSSLDHDVISEDSLEDFYKILQEHLKDKYWLFITKCFIFSLFFVGALTFITGIIFSFSHPSYIHMNPSLKNTLTILLFSISSGTLSCSLLTYCFKPDRSPILQFDLIYKTHIDHLIQQLSSKTNQFRQSSCLVVKDKENRTILRELSYMVTNIDRRRAFCKPLNDPTLEISKNNTQQTAEDPQANSEQLIRLYEKVSEIEKFMLRLEGRFSSPSPKSLTSYDDSGLIFLNAGKQRAANPEENSLSIGSFPQSCIKNQEPTRGARRKKNKNENLKSFQSVSGGLNHSAYHSDNEVLPKEHNKERNENELSCQSVPMSKINIS